MTREILSTAFLLGFIKAAALTNSVTPAPVAPTPHVIQDTPPNLATIKPLDPANVIKDNEGFRPTNYLDTLKKPTIGYGSRNPAWLAKGQITEPEAATELTNHLNGVTGNLQSVIGTNRFNSFPNKAQVALQDLGYQTGDIAKWPKLVGNAQTNNFAGMAQEIEHSKVNSQTPDRNSRRIQMMMEAGQ